MDDKLTDESLNQEATIFLSVMRRNLVDGSETWLIYSL